MNNIRLAGVYSTRVELIPWRPSLLILSTTVAATLALALILALSAFLSRGEHSEHTFSLWQWEASQLPSSIFTLLGVGKELDAAEETERLASYFRLTSAIRAELQADEPDQILLEELTKERSLFENDVERIIEGYVTNAVLHAGLRRPLPLFSGIAVLWPPVDIELTNPPQLLVRSPRKEIRRAGDTLLSPDLGLTAIEKIEAQTDNENIVSLVVSIGGLAAYPAIVLENRSYGSVLRLAAHEWVHHYLAFYPLGEAWGQGEGTKLNETVAHVAEQEIARLARELNPIALETAADGRAPPHKHSLPDFPGTMRQLRLDVDKLLEQGLVAEAETLMEKQRQQFASHGINIRKINQAYFAFYGSYANLPQSSDPIGPKVERVWEETKHLALFMSLVRNIRTERDLDSILVKLGVDPENVTVD
ncbi:MAG: hypothetical protein CL897_04635 [Dehalococcoidia bacterium]|nr:hypothetical protein [Dehalococcoidia bacterium]